MLKLILRQSSWGVLGHALTTIVGFFVTRYVFLEVGETKWGEYKTAHDFVVFSNTFLSIGIPSIILRFFPLLISQSNHDSSQILIKIFRYAAFVSVLFILLMIFLSPILSEIIWPKFNNFSYLLLIISIHVPISIFMGIIISLYRSVLKIKEILLYGTFISVPLRAILTFIVFYYFKGDIFYFVYIEIFTQMATLMILYYLFNKDEFRIFNIKRYSKYKIEDRIYNYGKNIYMKDVFTVLSTTLLPLLLSILLPAEYRGIYSILLTITALLIFINRPLRQIFAPAISKLFEEKDFGGLSRLYKKTTFIINLLTVPLSIILLVFTDEVLWWYSRNGEIDLTVYKPYLFVLVISRMISLFAGQTGTFMIMAGMERKELIIQIIKSIAIVVFACIFIPEYKLIAVVTIFISLMLFENMMKLIYLKKEINLSPYSSELFLLIVVSIPIVFFAINHQITFSLYHYILVPIIVYLFYFAVFYKRLKQIYLEIK